MFEIVTISLLLLMWIIPMSIILVDSWWFGNVSTKGDETI